MSGAKKRLLRTIMSPLLAFCAALLIVGAWERVVPVVVFMSGEPVRVDDAVIIYDVTGTKLRGCDFVKGSAVGWYQVAGVWYETPFAFVDDPTPDSNRANGFFRQHFGLWAWYDVPRGADLVRLTVQHECGADIATTNAGEFDAVREAVGG